MIPDHEIDYLALKVQEGRSDYRDRLLVALQPLTEATAQRWRIPGYDTGDVESIIMMSILESVPKFDQSRGPFRTYANLTIRTNLNKAKRPAKTEEESTTPAEFEIADTAQPPELSDDFDRRTLQDCWVYLTYAERRAVLTMLSGSKLSEIGELEGVSKQAIQKAIHSARSVMKQFSSGEPIRRKPHTTHIDFHLETVLANLAG